MAQSARNDDELVRMFKPVMEKVVNYVLDKILEANKIEIIEKVVYGAGEPSYYNRTKEFGKAWDKKTSTGGAHDVNGEFFYSPEKMSIGSVDPESHDYGQHIGVAGSYQGQDSRQYLAEIIYEGIAGPAFGHGYWNKKRDAFSRLVNHVGKVKFNQWFQQGCKKNGLKVNKIIDVEPVKT